MVENRAGKGVGRLWRGMLWPRVRAALPPAGRVLVALSGGVDSTALLFLVLPPPEERGRLVVGHVHHGTGAYADEAEALARDLAREAGVEVVVTRVRIAGERRREVGFEAAAREQRYRALVDLARKAGAVRVLTGHTLDDRAEGVLLYLLRGAGTGGLAGPREEREMFLRPLLAFSREELAEFIAAEGIRVLEDPSNRDLRYTRNRVRHRLRPVIEKEFGDRAWRNLAESARRLAAAEEALAAVAEEAWGAVRRGSSPRWISLDAERLAGYLVTIRVRLLRRAWAHAAAAREGRESLRKGELRRLEASLHRSPGSTLRLAGGVRVLRTDSRLILDGLADAAPLRWKLPGELMLPDGGTLRAEEWEKDAAGDIVHSDKLVEWVDAAALGDEVTVRPWRPGDRIEPFARPGHLVKVARVLASGASERRGPVWILESRGVVAWVPGHRLAHPFRVRPESRRLWRLSLLPLAETAP